jgi:hypothetical protein
MHTYIHISPMKKKLVASQRHTVLQETETTWKVLNRPTFKHSTFLRKQRIRFDRKCARNQTVYWCGNLSFTDCVGYDKLLFHERHTYLKKPHKGIILLLPSSILCFLLWLPVSSASRNASLQNTCVGIGPWNLQTQTPTYLQNCVLVDSVGR